VTGVIEALKALRGISGLAMGIQANEPSREKQRFDGRGFRPGVLRLAAAIVHTLSRTDGWSSGKRASFWQLKKTEDAK
jgi:hypothetical protein